ncbi:hypothetical protein ZYGR_0AI06640 [Zygosaccharomyces rouxii]|uniref:N-acetyltransferase domain-containing protein n=1 Tax=Zygosaccharomyces rouxii TaxID=4956 RepID=A0A1Q3ACM4_ZYGRO|nr:hypothetical protein ZYGR_0AI06640 [Zygosaccharomyces rouxii]
MIIYKPLDLENLSHFKQIKKLIDADLSEPYSIYVYRYFLNRWPELAYLAFDEDGKEPDIPIGCVVCKSETHRGRRMRGYIGMLAVESGYRGQGIAKTLVTKSIEKMAKDGCDEIMLETEVENQVALNLYENMGFIRMKRMFRYYLNEGDAYKLILPLTEKSCIRTTFLEDFTVDPNLIIN